MLNNKRVSLKTIIAKVYRDLQLKEEDVFLDMIEWGAEALAFIGAYGQLDHRVCDLNINLYKAELPLGFESIEQISYDGTPLVGESSNTYPNRHESVTKTYYTPTSYNQDKIMNKVFFGEVSERNLPEGFEIKGGYINTPFKDGVLTIKYACIPIDCEGYPEVPDNPSYIEAVYRYIVYKWMYPKVLTNQISPQMYRDAEEKWYWYCNQAGASAMMPDLNMLETIKRNYLTLKPNINMFNNFFKELKDN